MSERWTVETVILSAAILDLPERTVWDVVGPNGGQVARCYESDVAPQIVAEHNTVVRMAAVEPLRAALEQIEESALRWASKCISEGEANIHRLHAQMARAALTTIPAATAGGSAEAER